MISGSRPDNGNLKEMDKGSSGPTFPQALGSQNGNNGSINPISVNAVDQHEVSTPFSSN